MIKITPQPASNASVLMIYSYLPIALVITFTLTVSTEVTGCSELFSYICR